VIVRSASGFTRQKHRDPVRRPGALARVVDAGKRLQGDGLGNVLGERAAEVVPVASHGERRCADRTAEVEGEDLRPRIAAELQRHESQKNAFARASRADDQRVADVADVKGEAERR
jgi:hypothetical protein